MRPAAGGYGAPTEVPGSRVETPATCFGTGTPTYSGTSIQSDPYRVGDIVNMFDLKGAKDKNWQNSAYDFTADFSTTTTISYECRVNQHTEVYFTVVPDRPWPCRRTGSALH